MKENYTWGRGHRNSSGAFLGDEKAWQILFIDVPNPRFPIVVLGGIKDEWQARAVATILNADVSSG